MLTSGVSPTGNEESKLLGVSDLIITLAGLSLVLATSALRLEFSSFLTIFFTAEFVEVRAGAGELIFEGGGQS